MCKTEVQSGSEGAVRCCGQWCCSQSHADAYACRLYEALGAFQCRHAARHGVYVPRLTASTMDVAVSGTSGVGQGQQRGCGTWFASCRVAGGLSSMGDEG
jgi:hypothetical protein